MPTLASWSGVRTVRDDLTVERDRPADLDAGEEGVDLFARHLAERDVLFDAPQAPEHQAGLLSRFRS